VKQFFERRLIRYKEELFTTAAQVAEKRYRVAFVGTIAVGKSTVICRAEKLELPSQIVIPPEPVSSTVLGMPLGDGRSASKRTITGPSGAAMPATASGSRCASTGRGSNPLDAEEVAFYGVRSAVCGPL